MTAPEADAGPTRCLNRSGENAQMRSYANGHKLAAIRGPASHSTEMIRNPLKYRKISPSRISRPLDTAGLRRTR